MSFVACVDNKHTIQDARYAISPYYISGFVNQNGSSKAYLIRDMQGPAVTANLINHIPVDIK